MIFGREPVAIAWMIRCVILATMTFGVNLTPEQIGATMLAVESVLMVITRQSVTSPATLVDAGLTRAGVVATAEANVAKAEAKRVG